MAISSNRSPSPVSSKTNPDSKTQENIRRSFNGNPLVKPSRSFNPVTPANSPADYSRRNLGSKEGVAGLRSSYEYKENDKEQKRVKEGQVPKSTKSFMAPTISAISKISPSPRKKVLAERNETVRSSVSEFEAKSLIDVDLTDDVAEDDIGVSQVVSEPKNCSFKPRVIEFQEVEASQTRFVSSKSVEFTEVEEISVKPDVAIRPSASSQSRFAFSAGEQTQTTLKSNVDVKPSASPSPALAPIDTDPLFPKYESKIKNASPSLAPKPSSSPSPAMAPLDSDPHLPPYDPKTNYLSPRPRFLHYKPKPRVEVSPKKEGKNLEDSFTSESSSDAETTEETLSSGSLKESEDGASCELLSEEEEKEHLVSQIEPETTQLKESPRPKSRSFVRSKLVPFVLVFAIACLFIPLTDTPALSPSANNGHTFKFDGSPKIAEFAKENFNELASNLKVWSSKTVSYLSTLVSIPRVLEEPAPFYFSNSTNSNKEPLVYEGFGHVEKEIELDQIDIEPEKPNGQGDNVESPAVEEEYVLVTEQDSPIEIEEQPALVEPEIVEEEYVLVTEQDSPIEIEEQPALVEPEIVEEFGLYEDEKLDSDAVIEATPNIQVIPQSSELDSSILIENSEFDTLSPSGYWAAAVGSEMDATPQSTEESDTIPTQGLEQDVTPSEEVETVESGVEAPVNLFPVQNIVGIVSAVVTVVAAYLYARHNKATTTPEVGNPSLLKKVISRLSASGDSEDRFSSRPTEVEMGGDSGPSEMSSSFKRSFTYGMRGSERVNEEAQSHEKRFKYSAANKEALPSSSDYSYGSFTTYEKIHSKHGYGEDEVVTPVRRSSRIRKITSP